MREEKFQAMLSRIYAIFNRPTPSGEVRSILWEKAQAIPDEAVEHIVATFEDMERMPQNMVRELKNAWANWKSANPERIIREHCDYCDDMGFFWFFFPDEKGHMHLAAEMCPSCSEEIRSGKRVAIGMQTLTAAGCVIVPRNENPNAFAVKNGFDLWQAKNSGNIVRHQYSRRKSRIVDSRHVAPERIAHLPAEEREDYYGTF